MRPPGANIAGKGSAFYHFRVSTLDSAAGQRHYKIWKGIPNKKSPPVGFPAVYLLDGKAVTGRLSEGLLQTPSAQNPPVIVAVGYQARQPFELDTRLNKEKRRVWQRYKSCARGASASEHVLAAP